MFKKKEKQESNTKDWGDKSEPPLPISSTRTPSFYYIYFQTTSVRLGLFTLVVFVNGDDDYNTLQKNGSIFAFFYGSMNIYL